MSVHIAPGVVVVMDPAPVVYAKVFYEGSEPTRYLKRSANAVAALAKAMAPKKTGLMASRIVANQNRNELGQYTFGYTVESPVYYSHYVHEGTGPSVRRADGKAMTFQGTDTYSGQQVYTPVVYHPGTPRQPFLSRALVAMAMR